MLRVGNPSRRTHKKSKLGCLNCKRRHVRCDELRPKCTYCMNHNLECQSPLRFSEASCNTTGLSDTSLVASSTTHDLNPISHTLDTHGLPVDWSFTESRLIYGFVQVCIRMQDNQGHKLHLGTSVLPVLLMAAFHFDYARYALLNMLTSQLAHIQKSSQLQLLTQYYRSKAFGTLAVALNDFNRERADSIDSMDSMLITSVNLAYTSTNAREHKHLEDGVSAIITKMLPFRERSSLPQYFRGPYSLVYPPGPDEEPIPPKLNAISLSYEVSHAILSGLEKTKALFGGQKAFQDAAQNLWFVIYNVSDGGSRSSIKQHYDIQTNLRPLKFLGIEFLADMGKATAPELLLMSWQELVMLIVQELRPIVRECYFILAKADIITYIHGRLMEKLDAQNMGLDTVLYRSIIEVPYSIATTYQRCGRIALT